MRYRSGIPTPEERQAKNRRQLKGLHRAMRGHEYDCECKECQARDAIAFAPAKPVENEK